MSHATLCFLSYQRPAFLKTAIETAIAGTHEPVEVIVHDDGSTDRELLKYLYTLHQQGSVSSVILNAPGVNRGVGVAINRMFNIATGDPLIRADQDLIFKPDWLRCIKSMLESTKPNGLLVPVYYNNRKVASSLVDREDWELVNEYKWRWLNSSGYAHTTVTIDGHRKVLMMHQLLTNSSAVEGMQVDHINRRRLDNRRANLRVTTVALNRRNVGANRQSTSPYRGIGWNERLEKWVAQGQADGRTVHIGVFGDELEAAWAAEDWRREHHPDSAPDPLIVGPDVPPPIGLLSGFHYHHDPCDWRKTIRARHGDWEEHDAIMGSFFAMPRAAWEALGPFEEGSEAFAEDVGMMQRIRESQLWVCGTPAEDLMTNQGYGLGPSTVVVQRDDGELTAREIHQLPMLIEAR